MQSLELIQPAGNPTPFGPGQAECVTPNPASDSTSAFLTPGSLTAALLTPAFPPLLTKVSPHPPKPTLPHSFII
jgi:hypothetical protein